MVDNDLRCGQKSSVYHLSASYANLLSDVCVWQNAKRTTVAGTSHSENKILSHRLYLRISYTFSFMHV